jgi:hypothetical protein
MRALAVLLGLLMSIPVLAASPQIEAAIRVIQTVGTDANRLNPFCELMEVEEENPREVAPFLQTKIDKLLDELGADFKAAWKIIQVIDPASDDGKVLYAALDGLVDKCSE